MKNLKISCTCGWTGESKDLVTKHFANTFEEERFKVCPKCRKEENAIK